MYWSRTPASGFIPTGATRDERHVRVRGGLYFPIGRDRQRKLHANAPPVISINGENPAHVQVGDTYADLGATITGPQADLNLGIHLFLNGSPVDAIQLDTTGTATDTIDYVITDTADLSAPPPAR